jgi:hypothetical protein
MEYQSDSTFLSFDISPYLVNQAIELLKNCIDSKYRDSFNFSFDGPFRYSEDLCSITFRADNWDIDSLHNVLLDNYIPFVCTFFNHSDHDSPYGHQTVWFDSCGEHAYIGFYPENSYVDPSMMETLIEEDLSSGFIVKVIKLLTYAQLAIKNPNQWIFKMCSYKAICEFKAKQLLCPDLKVQRLRTPHLYEAMKMVNKGELNAEFQWLGIFSDRCSKSLGLRQGDL